MSTSNKNKQDAVGQTDKQQLIYCGPSLPRGVLNQYTVYQGGLPRHLNTHIEACPAIKHLFVPVDKLSSTQQLIGKAGTSENIWLKQVQNYIKGGSKA